MLIFFFILIFIAEVKLTYDLVCFIKHIDDKVCRINNEITAMNPLIEDHFTSFRIILNKTLLSLNKVHIKIKEKKEKYKIILAKNLITGILFLILNTNGKKILSIIDLAFDINNVLKKCSKIV